MAGLGNQADLFVVRLFNYQLPIPGTLYQFPGHYTNYNFGIITISGTLQLQFRGHYNFGDTILIKYERALA